MSVIFKRKLYNRMLAWKNERKGSTALLVKGARRVWKITRRAMPNNNMCVLSYKKLTQYKST